MSAHVVALLFPRAEPDFPDPQKLLGLPLAVLTVARSLVQAGFDVRIVDENVLGRAEDRLRLIPSPLFVGVSCLGGGQIPSGLSLARTVRRLWPGVPIVWGGWSPTMLPHLYEDAAMRSLVDVVVRGRGEAPAVAIAQRLVRRAGLHDVPGISFWKDGELHRNPDAPAAGDGEGPLPYDRIEEWDRYLTGSGILNFVSSYGCPHRCTFCGIPTVSRVFRPMENDAVVRQLADVKARGIHTVVFYDDNFFTSKARVVDLASRMLDADLGLSWHSNGRVDQLGALTDGDMELLRRSGCRSLNIGYETGDQAVADRVQKDILVADMLDLACRLHAAGIGMSLNFMVGLPGETPESLLRSLASLQALHSRHPGLAVCWYMFMPAPRTHAWRGLVAEGVLSEPSSLREHIGLQSMYLEHPWYYESPRDPVMRDRRQMLKAIVWCFYQAYAAPPPRSRLLRVLFGLRRKLCRYRYENRRFGLLWDWLVCFAFNSLRTRARWARARIRRSRLLRRIAPEPMPRCVSTMLPGVRPAAAHRHVP